MPRVLPLLKVDNLIDIPIQVHPLVFNYKLCAFNNIFRIMIELEHNSDRDGLAYSKGLIEIIYICLIFFFDLFLEVTDRT